ncbi:ankyrin repeat-containing domain protein [Aspergillus recurvatus]
MNIPSVEWDALDQDGRSALWWASGEGHTAVLRQLLSLSTIRASTNHPDALLQRSMLSRACERGDAAIVALLVGAESTDPNLRDEDGLVPLAWAARGGHNKTASMPLQTGRADINVQTPEPVSLSMAMEERASSQFSPSRRKGQTPVSHAAEMGHQKIVQTLLDHEAEINALNRFGKTPLMYALESDNLDMMSLLVSRGANPNCFNHDGETPLTLAHRSGHSAVWWAIVNNDIAMLDILQESGRVERNLREDATLLPVAARIGNNMDLTQGNLSSRIREQWVKLTHEDHGLNGPDKETDLGNTNLLRGWLTWPANLDDLSLQGLLDSPGHMELHKVGLSHQRRSCSSGQWQRIFGEEDSFVPFLDDLEEAHQEKSIREMPESFKASTLGRRFIRCNK